MRGLSRFGLFMGKLMSRAEALPMNVRCCRTLKMGKSADRYSVNTLSAPAARRNGVSVRLRRAPGVSWTLYFAGLFPGRLLRAPRASMAADFDTI